MNTRGGLAMVSETTSLQINFVNDSAELTCIYGCYGHPYKPCRLIQRYELYIKINKDF